MPSFTRQTSRRVQIGGRRSQAVELEGPALRAAVVPEAGGEVGSLQVNRNGRWVETLHRALDYSDAGDEWQGRAPLLWPAVGRSCVPEELAGVRSGDELITGSWRCEGVRRPMPIHGFARFLAFELLGSGADAESAWAELRAADSEYTRRYYPFRFELTCRHTLDRRSVRSRYTVRNLESGRSLPFSIGNHVTFRMPFTGEGSFDECTLTSPTTETLEMKPNGMTGGGRPPADLRGGRKLADEGLWNAAVCGFPGPCAAVELRDPASFGLAVSHEVLAEPPLVGREHMLFVLYSGRRRRYFCPEPWLGLPNSLNTGQGRVVLDPGAEWSWQMAVTLLSP